MKRVEIDVSVKGGIGEYMVIYLEWMLINNYSAESVRCRKPDLSSINNWLMERGVNMPTEITKSVIEQYQKFLFYRRKEDGNPLSNQRQSVLIVSIRAFCKWMSKNGYLLYNPAADIDLPKREHRIIRGVLTSHEVESIISQANTQSPVGLRDRAIMEVIYSTGIRRSEAAALKYDDIDYERGSLFISQGKGKRDRLIPIGSRALKWLEKYINEVRAMFENDLSGKSLFISLKGEPITANRLSLSFKEYRRSAKIKKSGACHLFRHSMATAMLENGADIRYIQEMLGHKNIETTQLYTHVTINTLKDVHTKTHPSATLRRRNKLV